MITGLLSTSVSTTVLASNNSVPPSHNVFISFSIAAPFRSAPISPKSSTLQHSSHSDNMSNQDYEESSDLESSSSVESTWEPKRTRAKTGASYWLVDNDRKCVAFCKMQMAVSSSSNTSLIVGWGGSNLSMGIWIQKALQSLGWVHRSSSATYVFQNQSCASRPL